MLPRSTGMTSPKQSQPSWPSSSCPWPTPLLMVTSPAATFNAGLCGISDMQREMWGSWLKISRPRDCLLWPRRAIHIHASHGAGVIGGIVSYFIAYTVTKGLDFLSSKTNGAFGRNAAREDVHEVDGPKVREQTFRIHNNKDLDDSSHSSEDGQAAKVRTSHINTLPLIGSRATTTCWWRVGICFHTWVWVGGCVCGELEGGGGGGGGGGRGWLTEKEIFGSKCSSALCCTSWVRAFKIIGVFTRWEITAPLGNYTRVSKGLLLKFKFAADWQPYGQRPNGCIVYHSVLEKCIYAGILSHGRRRQQSTCHPFGKDLLQPYFIDHTNICTFSECVGSRILRVPIAARPAGFFMYLLRLPTPHNIRYSWSFTLVE